MARNPAVRAIAEEVYAGGLEEDLRLAVAAHRPDHHVERRPRAGGGDEGGGEGVGRPPSRPVLGRVAGLEREAHAPILQEDPGAGLGRAVSHLPI